MNNLLFICLIGNASVALFSMENDVKNVERLMGAYAQGLRKIDPDAENKRLDVAKELRDRTFALIHFVYQEKLKQANASKDDASKYYQEITTVNEDHLALLKKLSEIEAAHASEYARIAALRPITTPPYPIDPDYDGLRKKADQKRIIDSATELHTYVDHYVKSKAARAPQAVPAAQEDHYMKSKAARASQVTPTTQVSAKQPGQSLWDGLSPVHNRPCYGYDPAD